MKIEYVLLPSGFFFKITDPSVGGSFCCFHTIRFLEPTKIGSLKSDRVNGPFMVSASDLVQDYSI